MEEYDVDKNEDHEEQDDNIDADVDIPNEEELDSPRKGVSHSQMYNKNQEQTSAQKVIGVT